MSLQSADRALLAAEDAQRVLAVDAVVAAFLSGVRGLRFAVDARQSWGSNGWDGAFPRALAGIESDVQESAPWLACLLGEVRASMKARLHLSYREGASIATLDTLRDEVLTLTARQKGLVPMVRGRCVGSYDGTASVVQPCSAGPSSARAIFDGIELELRRGTVHQDWSGPEGAYVNITDFARALAEHRADVKEGKKP